jgi:PAT family beta-lactamase induction signal transducer AmpG
MNDSQNILRIGAVGAALSSLTLVAMAFISLPAGLYYPGVEVLTEAVALSASETEAYLNGIRALFALDGVFLTGWLLAWAGIAELARKRSPLFGLLTLIFGLAGALFDFGENSMIWGALENLRFGILPQPQWIAAWKAVQHLSYWLPFIAAVFASAALWGGRRLEKTVAFAGSVLILPSAAGLYVPEISLLPNLWFLIWFACAALLLWRSAAENTPPPVLKGRIPMSDSKSRLLRLSLFAAVYFVEGAVLTYFSAFNVLYLRSFNLSFSLIGIAGGITLIPFILKIFIGLLSDRVSPLRLGYRKPYIVFGLVLQSLAFLAIPFVAPDSQFNLYLTFMVLAAVGMSTYDTTTDGLSIDTTPPEDRGLVQGLMVGGRALSAVVTASLMGLFSERGQWSWIFYLIAALGLLTLLLAFAVQEKKERSPEMQFSKEAFASFKDKAFALFLVLGVVYPLALYSAQGMVGAYLNEGLGISLSAVGIYTAVFGVGTIFGGVIGGPLMKKIGERASILAALLVTSAVTFVLALTTSAGLMWAVVFLFGFAFGYYETVYFALGMDFSDPRIAAFMFSIIMAVGNFGIAGGQPLAGVLVDSLGFAPMFMIFAAVHLLALPLVFAIFRLRKQRFSPEA